MYYFIQVMLYPLAAAVMGTLGIGLENWQYWAVLLIMFVLQIVTALHYTNRS